MTERERWLVGRTIVEVRADRDPDWTVLTLDDGTEVYLLALAPWVFSHPGELHAGSEFLHTERQMD